MNNWKPWDRFGRNKFKEQSLQVPLAAFLICFLLLTFPLRTTQGCIPYDDEFSGYSFVNQEILGKNIPYSRYFLNFDAFHKTYEESRKQQTVDNLQEWRGRFCNQSKPEDIYYIIYKASIDEIELIRVSARSKNLPLDFRLADNTFARQLAKSKCLETIDYLIFAKRCEPYVIPGSAWNTPPRDTSAMMQLVKEGRRQFIRTESHYIRLRYAYQLIRLAHYAKNYPATLELYDYLMPKIDKLDSILNYWIMGHKAGALRKMGENVLASYLYSLVFQNSPSKRESAYKSFYIRTDEEWKQCLLLCQNDAERAVLYAIRANNEDSKAVEEMQNIYELDPNSVNLELLLVKEIKKLERDLLGFEFNDKKRQNKLLYKLPRKDAGKYLVDLHQFVLKCNSEDQIRDKELWLIADGYLEFLSGDLYAARKTFETIRKEITNDTLVNQLDAFNLALKIASFEDVDNEDEVEIAGIIRKNKLYQTYSDFPDFLFDKLAYEYANNGHPGKAFRAQYSFSELKLNPQMDVVEDLLQLSKQEKRSIIEEAFVTDKGGKKMTNQLLDMKGTLLLSQFQLEAALEVFKQMQPSERIKYQFDPFIETIKDCVHCPPVDSVQYDKFTLIERLLELDYMGKADIEKGAENFYQIGLAFYNMSYFGSSWMAMDYYRSGANWYYVNEKNRYPLIGAPFGNKENVNLSQALVNFEKARLLAKNPEMAAKAAFMAARCEQKAYFFSQDSNYNRFSNQVPNLPEEYQKYYKLLVSKYSETEVYQQIIQECKYFQVYATK